MVIHTVYNIIWRPSKFGGPERSQGPHRRRDGPEYGQHLAVSPHAAYLCFLLSFPRLPNAISRHHIYKVLAILLSHWPRVGVPPLGTQEL
jgi:hypothetical protein